MSGRSPVIINEVIDAVKEEFRRQATDFGFQIKSLQDVMNQRQKRIDNLTTELNELKSLQSQDQQNLNRMLKKQGDYQETLQKIDSGDIVIQEKGAR